MFQDIPNQKHVNDISNKDNLIITNFFVFEFAVHFLHESDDKTFEICLQTFVACGLNVNCSFKLLHNG